MLRPPAKGGGRGSIMEDIKRRPVISHEDQKALAVRGYEVIRFLGEGAFSTVVLVGKQALTQHQHARERRGGMQAESLSDSAACKISNQTGLALREAEILAGIEHPLFPQYLGVWQEGEKVYLLMEYVSGSNLEALLTRRGSFSEKQIVRIGLELAEGLKYLHELPEPILYRDLKPANILLRQDGRVKLLDLGCACTTGRQTALAGTPEYAAPEQLKSGSVLTAASDVYGLGKTLQAMAGRKCGKGLKQVIAACIKDSPRERIPDMRGVISALASLEKGTGKSQKQITSGRAQVVCVNNVWESAYKRV